MRKKTGATKVVERGSRYKDQGSTGLDAEGSSTAEVIEFMPKDKLPIVLRDAHWPILVGKPLNVREIRAWAFISSITAESMCQCSGARDRIQHRIKAAEFQMHTLEAPERRDRASRMRVPHAWL
ncbi:hypothetical protein PHSY_002792 [Pseudozyma hubeiensis SY62]|uniref:Uncharacterized protein n=1 Tax=Pseudozyma hubeiensis (strain SY62) TaxID=1305764 RepID=R9P203_PSEHS|nr:hypothetical protein PHSY_002792 [Pseudozyma hubeiensis SY62]GAC95217.1 hypothetical protein PHSY_002792 [Pseudozyma hubeiensis SY62]